jgi:hypothetical protein
VRAALAPLFDRFSVDLVVKGHKHGYERTNPIRGERSTMQAPTARRSTPRGTAPPTSAAASGGHPRYAWQPGETDRYGCGSSAVTVGA